MLGYLSEKLQKMLRGLKGEGHLSERHIVASMREMRIILLEADVHFSVVREFISRVKEKALGQEVLRSLTPGHQVVKIVRDELVNLLGGEESTLEFSKISPSVILLVGLQGSGKTTTAGKLASWCAREGKQTLMVSTDVYRPAAIEQLSIIGKDIGIPVCAVSSQDPENLAEKAVQKARNEGFDVVLIDTAGRLHIDKELMCELERIQKKVQPVEKILVADAMTGQDAVNSALEFNARLDLTGVILTKMDGDARGGAAFSMRSVTGCPIKFIGVGEKNDALEVFRPERMASRILGMGDVLSLIEKAEAIVDQEQADEMVKRLQSEGFTLEDFRQHLLQIQGLGPMENILEMLPKTGPFKGLGKVNMSEKQLNHLEAIISSMTRKERIQYKIINGSRRRRIAKGSGRPVSEVNRLLKQYVRMRKVMRKFNNVFIGKGLPKLSFMI